MFYWLSIFLASFYNILRFFLCFYSFHWLQLPIFQSNIFIKFSRTKFVVPQIVLLFFVCLFLFFLLLFLLTMYALPLLHLHILLTIQWSAKKEKYRVTFIAITCKTMRYILQSKMEGKILLNVTSFLSVKGFHFNYCSNVHVN